MGKLVRTITSDGLVMATAVDTTDVVATAEQIHGTSAVATAALGRLLTAASMMGNMLKDEESSITLRVAGDGPLGSVVAVSDNMGNVRGYVTNHIVELPLNSKGKLDVGGAVGKGNLFILKDLAMKEPYNGCIPLVSGEIAEDITSYYATSEQIPTVCALGVLVNPDLTVKSAGGFIIQLLPAAGDDTAELVEKGLVDLPSVTNMLSMGMTPLDMIKLALKEFEVEELYSEEVEYRCNCSEERVKSALVSLGNKELEDMSKEMPDIEVKCHFCDKVYKFSPDEIRKMIEK
ncbi:MAG: Hsp33 family molecular chaperone HslO [Clostridia bacterium]|nr:Hsp33 family molecular chaperone HslO [Clostridia bacterium]